MTIAAFRLAAARWCAALATSASARVIGLAFAVSVLTLAAILGLPSGARAQAPPSGSDAPAPGGAAPAADPPQQQIESLRQQIETLRREYDARLAALEQQLNALSAQAAAPQGTAAAPALPPPAAAPEQGQVTAPPAPEQAQGATPPAPEQPPSAPPEAPGVPQAPAGSGSPTAFSKVFNPDMAVIGNMLGAVGTNHREDSPALELSEAEASFQAVVDPYARGDFFVSFGPDGAQVEEGFITFTSLPAGLLVKAGKLRSQFGKVNTMHTHALPWTDRPLVTRNLVGGDEGLSDGGLSVSKLLINPLFFLEATGEVFGGRSDVFTGNERSKVSYTGRVRGYRDLTEGTNLDLGASYAWGHTDLEADSTRSLIGIDATFRWRPLRRAIYRRFLGRTELVWSRDHLSASDDTAFGTYASGEYQFARRWFAGARFDYSERAAVSDRADKGGALTLTFWPSEFSQVRGQYRRTRYAEQVTANEFLFQFLFSIGAHGAHVF